jgi:hypothetical protein
MSKVKFIPYTYLLLILLGTACGWVHPKEAFNSAKIPAQPDYTQLANWAAHPDKVDHADRTPCSDLQNLDEKAPVDVFFIYPTTYTGSKKYEKNWNGAVEDTLLNKKTDESPILFQASIFNGCGRIFAPRYRQAHLNAFYTKDKKSAKQALDIAYEDVKAAFDYYLKHWNKGRPFILAGHSQGGMHSMYLLRDMIEGTPLQKQLVVAYIVGWPVDPTFFKSAKPCATPDQTDCYCTWRTYERNYVLKNAERLPQKGIVCTNPINWSIEPRVYAPKSANMGGVVRPFCAIYPELTDAEVYNGVVMSVKPKFPGSVFMRTKNYHPGDLNLFYMNVQKNAQDRIQAYLKK